MKCTLSIAKWALCNWRSHGTKSAMLEIKLSNGTSRTKRLHQDKFAFSLLWMSQCVACSPAWWILYHVTASCKGPIYLHISYNHSTSHALIHLLNKISSAIDQHETTVGIFLDLSKAFDTINHDILLTKLEHYGIRDLALQWIKSYFSYRYQFVQFNQTCSPMQTIKCGVPQGFHYRWLAESHKVAFWGQCFLAFT